MDGLQVNHIGSSPDWKIGVGYDFPLSQKACFSDLLVELNYYWGSETPSGQRLQYQIPAFNNYSFEAPIQSSRLMLDFKPTLFNFNRFSFYPIIGGGVGWNKTSYQENALITGIPPAYSLTSNTVSFAYDLGLGTRVEVTQHLQASVEYLYTNLGNINLPNTAANGTVFGASPKFNLQTEMLLFGLNWKF